VELGIWSIYRRKPLGLSTNKEKTSRRFGGKFVQKSDVPDRFKEKNLRSLSCENSA
jgi:hypothetical protein